jgi:hypothetical protein
MEGGRGENLLKANSIFLVRENQNHHLTLPWARSTDRGDLDPTRSHYGGGHDLDARDRSGGDASGARDLLRRSSGSGQSSNATHLTTSLQDEKQ